MGYQTSYDHNGALADHLSLMLYSREFIESSDMLKLCRHFTSMTGFDWVLTDGDNNALSVRDSAYHDLTPADTYLKTSEPAQNARASMNSVNQFFGIDETVDTTVGASGFLQVPLTHARKYHLSLVDNAVADIQPHIPS